MLDVSLSITAISVLIETKGSPVSRDTKNIRVLKIKIAVLA